MLGLEGYVYQVSQCQAVIYIQLKTWIVSQLFACDDESSRKVYQGILDKITQLEAEVVIPTLKEYEQGYIARPERRV